MSAPSPETRPILLVDDEADLLFSMSMVLRMAGIAPVETLSDSRLVLPFLEKQETALLVLDLSMPFLPGGELLPEVVKRFPNLPVIIISAQNDAETAHRCREAGARNFVPKPVDREAFIACIRKALPDPA